MTDDSKGAQTIAMTYLQLCQDRELDAAALLLHPGAELTFPGPHILRDVAELPSYARSRYQHVEKTVTDAWTTHNTDEAIVTLTGSLAGVTCDGRSFDSVRFIDVIRVRDGRITSQAVWNDLAEAGIIPLPEKGA